MGEEVRRAAIVAVTNILEKMFFVFAEEQREKARREEPVQENKALSEEPSARWVWGEIGLQGAASGQIFLTLPYPLALTLAANFMGAEEKEVSEAELLDAVSELNNMISGNLFSLLNKKGQYSLTKPKTELISGEEKRKRSPDSGLKIYFNADGQKVELNLLIPQAE
jgi:CheY-specific phosphatase CheX